MCVSEHAEKNYQIVKNVESLVKVVFFFFF